MRLEEHSDKRALVFGTCRIERNGKWAKHLERNVSHRIRTIESLEKVTTEIAAEAFVQSCNMKPEWARWLISYGVVEEDELEANMIFAVCPCKSIMASMKLPKSLWGEILQTIAYWENRSRGQRGITPYERANREKPNLRHLRVIGSRA